MASLFFSSSTKTEDKSPVTSSTVSSALSFPILGGSGLQFLYANKDLTKIGSESVPSSPSLSIDVAALRAISRSVYQPGKVYRFKLNRYAVVTTSGAGALQIATNVTPANMIEYAGVNALFQECRLMSTRITYAMYAEQNSPTTVIGVCLSFDPSNQSSTPTISYALQQPGAKLFNSNSGAGSRLTNFWKGDGKRPWSLTTASSAGIDPVGGSIGTWYTSLTGTTTASQNFGAYHIQCDYEFRNPL
jgi:hypothetical protein